MSTECTRERVFEFVCCEVALERQRARCSAATACTDSQTIHQICTCTYRYVSRASFIVPASIMYMHVHWSGHQGLVDSRSCLDVARVQIRCTASCVVRACAVRACLVTGQRATVAKGQCVTSTQRLAALVTCIHSTCPGLSIGVFHASNGFL